jgi:cyclophilin family peptidyl-prolyl cis-trans isomerase
MKSKTCAIMIALATVVAMLVVGGCRDEPEVSIGGSAPPEEPVVTEPTVPTPDQPVAVEPEEDTNVTEATDTVIKIETDKGDIICKLFDEKAPITAGSFLLLVEDGFYDGLTFHRVEPGFVIQGGDPAGNGSGGPGFAIPLEVSPELKHAKGLLSMARTSDPDSAGSQFFICLGNGSAVNFLDMQYAVFGEVTEGIEVVDQIAVGDVMNKVSVISAGPYAEAARAAAKEVRIR